MPNLDDILVETMTDDSLTMEEKCADIKEIFALDKEYKANGDANIALTLDIAVAEIPGINYSNLSLMSIAVLKQQWPVVKLLRNYGYPIQQAVFIALVDEKPGESKYLDFIRYFLTRIGEIKYTGSKQTYGDRYTIELAAKDRPASATLFARTQLTNAVEQVQKLTELKAKESKDSESQGITLTAKMMTLAMDAYIADSVFTIDYLTTRLLNSRRKGSTTKDRVPFFMMIIAEILETITAKKSSYPEGYKYIGKTFISECSNHPFDNYKIMLISYVISISHDEFVKDYFTKSIQACLPKINSQEASKRLLELTKELHFQLSGESLLGSSDHQVLVDIAIAELSKPAIVLTGQLAEPKQRETFFKRLFKNEIKLSELDAALTDAIVSLDAEEPESKQPASSSVPSHLTLWETPAPKSTQPCATPKSAPA